jgi:lipopolysaccharide biosynthesis glycosyltransferase
MINFVLCFDKNYNDVAYLFLHTLLNEVNEKINVYIIHNDPISFTRIKKKLIESNSLDEIFIYKFDKDLSIFPGITHGHISEATYYRFFFDDYLPKNLDYFLYVDADIICYKNPIDLIKSDIKRLEKSGQIIAARTEVFKEKEVEPHWDRLKLSGERYFNAGVLLINYQKWLSESISKKLYKNLTEFKDILLYWDQDVMNMVIDDKFLEINPNLNFDLYISTDQNNLSPLEHFGQDALDNMSLLHYTGSIKPWTVRGSFNKKARYFHDAYYELFKVKYWIKNTWRVSALSQLLLGIVKLHIKNLKYPFSFIKIVLKSLTKPPR